MFKAKGAQKQKKTLLIISVLQVVHEPVDIGGAADIHRLVLLQAFPGQPDAHPVPGIGLAVK